MKSILKILCLVILSLNNVMAACPTDVENQGINALVGNCDPIIDAETIMATKIKSGENISSAALNLVMAAFVAKIDSLKPQLDLTQYTVNDFITGSAVRKTLEDLIVDRGNSVVFTVFDTPGSACQLTLSDDSIIGTPIQDESTQDSIFDSELCSQINDAVQDRLSNL